MTDFNDDHLNHIDLHLTPVPEAQIGSRSGGLALKAYTSSTGPFLSLTLSGDEGVGYVAGTRLVREQVEALRDALDTALDGMTVQQAYDDGFYAGHEQGKDTGYDLGYQAGMADAA